MRWIGISNLSFLTHPGLSSVDGKRILHMYGGGISVQRSRDLHKEELAVRRREGLSDGGGRDGAKLF